MALDNDQRKKVIEMYRAGKKTADITAATGVPRSTIYFVLREAEITPRRQRGHRRGPIGTELTPAEHTKLLDWALARVTDLERENGQLRERLRAAAEVLAG